MNKIFLNKWNKACVMAEKFNDMITLGHIAIDMDHQVINQPFIIDHDNYMIIRKDDEDNPSSVYFGPAWNEDIKWLKKAFQSLTFYTKSNLKLDI